MMGIDRFDKFTYPFPFVDRNATESEDTILEYSLMSFGFDWWISEEMRFSEVSEMIKLATLTVSMLPCRHTSWHDGRVLPIAGLQTCFLMSLEKRIVQFKK